jgi:hypothetical protein
MGATALLAFMAWNGYIAVNHSRQMQRIGSLIFHFSHPLFSIQFDVSTALEAKTMWR